MKTIFWNVDTQYDFMRDDKNFRGALPVPNAREIEPNLERLTKLAERRNLQVVNTADWHTLESVEFSENPDFITTFPAHCLQNTKGAEFIPVTAPKNTYVVDWRAKDIDAQKIKDVRNLVLYKDAFDIFTGNPYTDRVVDIIKPDKAIVYGVARDVCVDYAVNGLLDRNVDVYVAMDATKELNLPDLDERVDKWQDKGATILNASEVY